MTQVVVGSPGIYDRRRDTLMLAAGLPGWGQAGRGAELRRAFGLSTVVENDINLAALAEHDHGHGRVWTLRLCLRGHRHRHGPGAQRAAS